MHHGYRNGDYILYQNTKLQVAVRHTQSGTNVAGNGAWSLSGQLMNGNRLTVYHRADRLGIRNTYAYWNGAAISLGAVCAKIKAEGVACQCTFDWCGNMSIRWSAKWMWKTNGCSNSYGWKNFYLYVDPAHRGGETGICTYRGWNNQWSPFPNYRLYCHNTPFNKFNMWAYCRHNYGRRLEDLQTLGLRRRQDGDGAGSGDGDAGDGDAGDGGADAGDDDATGPDILGDCDQALKDAAKAACGGCGDDVDDLHSCMIDACIEGNASGAEAQNSGCVQKTLIATPPDERTALCAADEVFSEDSAECVVPPEPETCVYDQCENGIEVKGAGYAAVNGLYEAAYGSCDDIPRYGVAAFGVSVSGIWKKTGDDKATIDWVWAANDMRGWTVSYDGESRYYDGANRESPAIFVDGTYTTRSDGGFASDPAATVTCVGPPTPPPTPAPELNCEAFKRARKVCPDSCGWEKKKGCITKPDGPQMFSAEEFCSYHKRRKTCKKFDVCVFLMSTKKCIAKEKDICANYRSPPQCRNSAKCINNVACNWNEFTKKCEEGGYCV